MLAAISFPTWIRPEVIPGLPFRWYGLMYVVAFLVTWGLFSYESKRRRSPWSEDDSAGFFFWAILGLLVGARLFGTLLYDPTGYYLRKPWFIVWPFDEAGRFIGFQGMSFHGGFLGLIVATLIYARVKKISWLSWADIIAVCAPLGYTAGRLGNFINGELWGKVSDKPWAMIFPNAEKFSAREQWVQDFAQKVGIPLSSMNDLVNLPRHPSQLYEAIFEGLVLWLVLWFFVRKRKSSPGFSVGCYAIGYGAIRFVIEYFREPDQGMGYILPWGNPTAPTYMYTTPWNFSMGQILSFGMILVGAGVIWYGAAAQRRAEARAAAEAAEKARVKSETKKLRKKGK
jgi:phosphatidylglycerol:prolipoprotein diacylglycerol transferase